MSLILFLLAAVLCAADFKAMRRFLTRLRFQKIEGRVLSLKYFSYPFWGNHNFLDHQKVKKKGVVIVYRYDVQETGKWFTGNHEIGDLSLGSALSRLEKGDRVTVYYDLENPAESTLHRSPPGGVLFAMLLLALALFFALW
jgi:hypothetical protein